MFADIGDQYNPSEEENGTMLGALARGECRTLWDASPGREGPQQLAAKIKNDLVAACDVPSMWGALRAALVYPVKMHVASKYTTVSWPPEAFQAMLDAGASPDTEVPFDEQVITLEAYNKLVFGQPAWVPHRYGDRAAALRDSYGPGSLALPAEASTNRPVAKALLFDTFRLHATLPPQLTITGLLDVFGERRGARQRGAGGGPRPGVAGGCSAGGGRQERRRHRRRSFRPDARARG